MRSLRRARGYDEGLARARARPAGTRARHDRSTARSTSCAGPTSCSPTRARTTARCRRDTARIAGRRLRRRASRRADARARCGRSRVKVGIRERVLSRRHGGPLFRALDHRPAARDASRCSSITCSRRCDALDRADPARADHVRAMSRVGGRRRSRRTSARDALDVLVYPELGMDAVTFALAALRLAPVQCAAWGHPVTTGLPTIDVFFSCACMETAGRRDRTTRERLVTLPGIGTRYAMPARRPAIAANREAARAAARVRPLFLCPQSLFKIHPDNDALFARVLDGGRTASSCSTRARTRADGEIQRGSRCVRARAFARRSACIVLPQRSHDEYLRGQRRVRRDARHACAGRAATRASTRSRARCRSSRCPGAFMRARQSAAMLATMACRARRADQDDYVRKAAAIATDGAYAASSRAGSSSGEDTHLRRSGADRGASGVPRAPRSR